MNRNGATFELGDTTGYLELFDEARPVYFRCDGVYLNGMVASTNIVCLCWDNPICLVSLSTPGSSLKNVMYTSFANNTTILDTSDGSMGIAIPIRNLFGGLQLRFSFRDGSTGLLLPEADLNLGYCLAFTIFQNSV